MQRSSIGVSLCLGPLTALTLAASCSTLEEEEPDPAPICEDCDPGEQTLQCRLEIFYDGVPDGYPAAEYQFTCLDPDSDTTAQEQACVDRCDEYIDTRPDKEHLTCDFLAVEEPYFWTGCVPPDDPTGTGGGQGLSCPSWYSPSTKVSDYENLSSTEASVTIDRDFAVSINQDLFSLYSCDDARYVESTSGWEFEDLNSGELLYELGVRDGDENASVQGFDPTTTKTTTSVFDLDSIDDMLLAYDSLSFADGVVLTVDRTGVQGGQFTIWITID